MMKQFETLTQEERDLLFKTPVLVSLLASGAGEMHSDRKVEAIKLAHVKAFVSHPLLHPYYAEVERHFETQFEAAANQYSPLDDKKRNDLKEEIAKATRVIEALDPGFGSILYISFNEYGTHVKEANHTVFRDFIFPIPISGFSAWRSSN